jgi:hypothetical protein
MHINLAGFYRRVCEIKKCKDAIHCKPIHTLPKKVMAFKHKNDGMDLTL